MAADAGVDDVHIIAALALHRRMHEFELRHALGDRVYDAFEPRGMLYQHDAEDPDKLAFLGTTPEGEEVEINKRAAESDLLVYVNINLVAMDGGWKSTATGLAVVPLACATTTTPTTHGGSRTRFMDQHKSELHKSDWRMGKVHARPRPEDLPDRDDAQHRHVPEAVRLPVASASGSGTPRTGRPTWRRRSRSTAHAAAARPQDLPRASRRRTR